MDAYIDQVNLSRAAAAVLWSTDKPVSVTVLFAMQLFADSLVQTGTEQAQDMDDE